MTDLFTDEVFHDEGVAENFGLGFVAGLPNELVELGVRDLVHVLTDEMMIGLI